MKFIDNKWKVISENERLQLTKTEGQVHKNPFCSSLLPFFYTVFSFPFKSGRFRPVWASRVKMLRDNSTTQQLFDLKWYYYKNNAAIVTPLTILTIFFTNYTHLLLQA